MGGAWTGIIMRHSEFLTPEYELSVSASAAPVGPGVPGARTIPPKRPDLNDLVGSEMRRKGTLTDEAERSTNDTTPRSRLMNALAPETGMFNGFAIERRRLLQHASIKALQMAFPERAVERHGG